MSTAVPLALPSAMALAQEPSGRPSAAQQHALPDARRLRRHAALLRSSRCRKGAVPASSAPAKVTAEMRARRRSARGRGRRGFSSQMSCSAQGALRGSPAKEAVAAGTEARRQPSEVDRRCCSSVGAQAVSEV